MEGRKTGAWMGVKKKGIEKEKDGGLETKFGKGWRRERERETERREREGKEKEGEEEPEQEEEMERGEVFPMVAREDGGFQRGS